MQTKFFPKGSLAAYSDLPQALPVNMADIPAPVISGRVKQRHNGAGSQPSADTEAVEFYATNHLAAYVKSQFLPGEILPKWAVSVMETYADILTQQAERMFCYMVLICTRESRHLHKQSDAWWKKCPGGQESRNFHNSINGCGSDQAVTRFFSGPPKMNLGAYTDGLSYIFNKGKFSSGYGGKAWGQVADCLTAAVNGKISLEMMVDSAYSLAHNNGPIFNKGMFYSGYSNKFIQILDVQRSGQMPEAVLGFYGWAAPCSSKIKDLVGLVNDSAPKAFGDYLDWWKVEALGSLGKYAANKKAQEAAGFGPAKKVDPNQKGLIQTGTFTVFPGVSVPQFKRVA